MNALTSAFTPGTGRAWCFLAGFGSVLLIAPGVVNPVYEDVNVSFEQMAGDAIDAHWVAEYWASVGADLGEAIGTLPEAA